MSNKVEKKWFMGMEVRVVNDEYIVLKDMFSALGRVKDDGTWTNEKNKMAKFLEDVGKTTDHQLLVVTSKGKKQSRETQEFDCMRLETVPIVLTQFRPTNSNKRSSDENELALKTWREFMMFVDDILTSLEVHKYIVTDKKVQLDHHALISELGGKPVVENQMVNQIMAQLIGIDGSVKKEELRLYQNQTTIDLLEVRDYIMTKFENAYEFTGSHSQAKDMTLKLALKKYPFKLVA